MAAGALGLSACAAQATTDYQGDPLFSMTGRVELQLTSATDQALIPVLAFMAPDSDEIRFVQPEVSGEFPASFRVDLYAPPPASVIDGWRTQDIPGEPRHSFGFITAVAPEHPPVLYAASSASGAGGSCDDSGVCEQIWEVRNFDATRRGTVTTVCPPEDETGTTFLACNVKARTGDPMMVSVFNDPIFAGAADNYAVAYLETPAAPNSFVAHRFGAPAGLAAGYHLLRALPGDAMAEPATQACRDAAKTEAVRVYNAMHGAATTELDILVRGCNEPGCEMMGPHTRALRGVWYRLMAERRCSIGRELEPASPAEQVSLRVQPGLNFIRAFASY